MIDTRHLRSKHPLAARNVGNHFRHSSRGGSVHISARRLGDDVVITVAEDGPGAGRGDWPTERLNQRPATSEKRLEMASGFGSSPVNRCTTRPSESSTTQYGKALRP